MTLSEWLDAEPRRASRLARHLGISPVCVSQWKTGTRPVPAEHCPEIERFTNGAVRCETMLPNVNWGWLRGTPYILEAA
ncbi:MAG: helix-turn-helix domain-containing protein [Verrucomicrobiae bacterium]|nr:helix-turn-helix domain-containing protein [Verrucomicrobiae bacterium]